MSKETCQIVSLDMEDVRRMPEGTRNVFLHFARANGGEVTTERVTLPWDRDQMVRLLQQRDRWVSDLFRVGLLVPFRNRMLFEAEGYSDRAIVLEGYDLVQSTFVREHLRLKRGVLSDVHLHASCLGLQACEVRDCTFTDFMELRAKASAFDGLGAKRVQGLVRLEACTLQRVELSGCKLDGLFEGCVFEGCTFYSLRGFQGPLRFESCRFDTCRFFNTFPEEVEALNCTFFRCRGHLDGGHRRKVVPSRHAERSANGGGAGDPAAGGGDLLGGVNPADTPDPGGAFPGD